ncbi:MAG: energy transducer TonB [Pseudomonadota bacterium]
MNLPGDGMHYRSGYETCEKPGIKFALIGSLLLHCGMAALATAVALQRAALPEPVVIDLTATSLPTTEQKPHSPAAQRSQQRATGPVTGQQPLEAEKAHIHAPAPVPAAPTVTEHNAESPDSAGEPSAVTASSVAGDMTATGAGTTVNAVSYVPATPDTTETQQKRYLHEHFAYIRNRIGKELRYPRAAVRMGWSGRVTVTFMVLLDGSVSELQVSDSSGVPLLDSNALDTVRKAAPFPKPPVSARLVMPMDYILE